MSNLLNRIFDQSFDDESHSLSVISEPHRMTHKGFMFHGSGKITGMLDAGVQDLLIITGTKHAHLQRMALVLGRGDIDILVYEGATTSASGSAVPLLCTNRESTNTPLLTYFTGPTVTGVGSLIHTNWIPPTATGIGQSGEGIVGGGNGEEWEFAASTKYLMRITNNSGATIDLRHELLFYEPDF